jgi:hypothetical protein
VFLLQIGWFRVGRQDSVGRRWTAFPGEMFKVTLTCLFSGEAFRDPDPKLKGSCIVSVSFDALTNLIPAAKIKLLDKASKPIGRSAKTLTGDLAKTRRLDGKLIEQPRQPGRGADVDQAQPARRRRPVRDVGPFAGLVFGPGSHHR